MLRCATRYRLWPRYFGPPAILGQRRPGIEKQSRIPVARHDRRAFGLDALSAVLIPPAVFGGLLVTLWTYKCLMMIIFQNKIIYMPFVPPFSRSEKVSDYAAQCRPVVWKEHVVKASDGVAIKLLEGTAEMPGSSNRASHVVALYFQGYVCGTDDLGYNA